MKKLLIMASLFWPQKNSGGPPVSLLNLVNSIGDRFDIYIISKNHEIGSKVPLPGIKEGWNSFSFGKAFYVPYGRHSFDSISRLIQQVQPDVIYQNSFFSWDDLRPVLSYKKKHPCVKVIVAPRGELYPERFQKGKIKKQVYSAFIRISGLLKDVYFQGTGADECEQCHRLLGIPKNHLLNIQNLSVVPSEACSGIEKKPGSVRLVFIARIHPTKNVLQAIQWLGQVKSSVEFDLYGPIENQDYWQACSDAIKALPGHIRVNYRGAVEHERVPELIAQYHGYYMPTSGENFGHSIVESMLVGRPVLISDQTPWTDVDGLGGFVIPLNQPKKFVEALETLSAMEQEEYDCFCSAARDYIIGKLNTEEIVKQYVQAFDGE